MTTHAEDEHRRAPDARETEYSQLMRTDTLFCETEELRERSYAARGLPFTPVWRWWPKSDTPRQRSLLQLGRTRPITPRPIICVQTGEVYVSIRSLARLMGVTVTTLKGYVTAERQRHGKTYRYATEVERGQL